jgi:hypothetical protein
MPAIERPATTADAVELVAAGVGLLVLPQSLARLHHRKDLTYRTLSDAPQSSVALSWLEEQATDLMEEFIGIVRGRTVNSSRGRTPAPSAPQTPSTAQAKQKQGQPQKRDASGGKRSPRKTGSGQGRSRKRRAG